MATTLSLPTGDTSPLAPAIAFLRGKSRAAAAVRAVAGLLAFYVVEQLLFHTSTPQLISGVCLGALFGLLGVGLVLIYRTARVINFAAAAIGAIPAITFLLVNIRHGANYLLMFPLALVGGLGVGAGTDVVVIRRFSKAPRLILTVITLGLAQTLGVLGFFIPIWLGAKANSVGNVVTPFNSLELKNGRGQPVLTGNQVFALLVVIGLTVALSAFLRYTRIGIALRASAENADRASLLGIPVKSVQTAAWAIAGLLAAAAVFTSAPLIGVPPDATEGFDTLLYALAAAVVGRMEKVGVTLVAGMAIGVIDSSAVTHYGDASVAAALMLPIILGALLLQRGKLSRAQDSGVSSYTVLKEYRPIPFELKGLPEVRSARLVGYALIALVIVGAPFVIHKADLPELVLLPIYGIVGVSMVVLTGWAGQISLGQFGFVGIGAAVAGKLVVEHNIDFFAACGVGIAAGAVAAVLVGLPALRVQGLFLAVTTLAFGFTVYDYVLNRHYSIGKFLLGTSELANMNRPDILGRIQTGGPNHYRSFYFVCMALLALVVLCALSFRRLRSGRILIAARDNQRAAPAYSINLVRTRLAAFAVSGGMAGLAGVLLAYSEQQVVQGSYNVTYSIIIFLAVIIGGPTSVLWAAWGAISLELGTLFLPSLLHGAAKALFGASVADILNGIFPLVLTGPLLIINLIQNPSGFQDPGFQARDTFLRRIANRHGLLVPSLVADRRADAADREAEGVIAAAEAHVEAVEAERGVDHGELPHHVAALPAADAVTEGSLR